VSFLHLLHAVPISTSWSRDFKPTDVPHRFKLKIYSGGHNEPPDEKATRKAEEFRVANDYVSAKTLDRRFVILPLTFYEYTFEFEPRPVPEPASNRKPRVVSFNGDSTAEALGVHLRRGDWQAIEQFLVAVEDSQYRDFYVSTLAAELSEYPRWLDEWVQQRPNQYLPLVFRGSFKVGWAWRARSDRRASYVSDEQFRVFHERLAMARVDLEAAAAISPADQAGAFAFLLPVAMGLGWDKATAIQIYQEAQRRRPWHQLVHASMIQVLAPKWGGSLDLMFDFARSTIAAPMGSGAPIAIFNAHIEAATEAGTAEYWKGPAILPEVLAAARRTVWAPGAYETPLTLAVHRSLLYCLVRLDDADDARREFDAVDGRLGHPFTNLQDPVGGYEYLYKKMNGLLPADPPAADRARG
jgi:hypothetical protein